jgi:hypothetical protein
VIFITLTSIYLNKEIIDAPHFIINQKRKGKIDSPMSTEGTIKYTLIKNLNLLLHSQLVLLYIIGFKRLFYHQGEDKSQRKISVLKILIFLLYLCAFVLAFLQFADGNIPVSVREEWRNKENVELMEMLPISIYGFLAFTIVVIIFLSISRTLTVL